MKYALLMLLVAAAPCSAGDGEPIHIPLPTVNINLDPTGVQDVSSLLVARQLHCQLVRMRGREAVPEAAQQIQFVTPTVLRMTLNPAARFIDGRPVRARDVVATFNLLKSSRLVLRNFFAWIGSITAVDDQTVEFRLLKPFPSFLKFLGAPNYAIMPEDFIKRAVADPSLWRTPVGCGKYRVTKWDDATGHIRIDPTGEGRPVVFHRLGARSLTKSELDGFDVVDATFGDALDEVPSGYREEGVFDPRQIYLSLNTELPFWKSRQRRCEFFSRIDRAAVVAGYHGRAELPRSFFPRGILGYSADWSAFESTSTVQALGRPFTLAFLEVSVPSERRAAFEDAVKRAAAAELKTIVIRDAKRFGEQFRATGGDAMVVGLKSNYLDGYEFLLMLSEPAADTTGFRDPGLRRDITDSQQISDPAQRAEAYRDIAGRIRGECLLLPVATIPHRRVLVKSSLGTPGLGEVPINEYDLSRAR